MGELLQERPNDQRLRVENHEMAKRPVGNKEIVKVPEKNLEESAEFAGRSNLCPDLLSNTKIRAIWPVVLQPGSPNASLPHQ